MKLTIEEVQMKNKRVDELNARLARINQEKQLFQGGAGNDEPYFNLITEQEEMTKNEIDKINRELSSAEIVDPSLNNVETVGLGDKVELIVTDELGESFTMVVTLASEVMGFSRDTISLKSPMGMAINGQMIGTEVPCTIPLGDVKVQIVGKVKELDTQMDTQMKR